MFRRRDGIPTLTTPIVTPFDRSRKVDLKQFTTLLDCLVDRGIENVMVGGTTGEFASLSSHELERLVFTCKDHIGNTSNIAVGGAPSSTTAACEWLEMIESAGVDSGVVTAPYFHNSNSTEGLIEFFKVLNDASSIPLILYNIPAYVGETLPIEVVSKISQLDRFVGIKDSSSDLSYGLKLIDATSEDFAVIQGFDPLLIASLQMGFDGGVNALSNVVPEIYLSIMDNPTLADSNELQHRIIEPLFRLCSDYGFAPATKAALAYRGWLASATVRPPLTCVKPHDVAHAMQSIFDSVDISSS